MLDLLHLRDKIAHFYNFFRRPSPRNDQMQSVGLFLKQLDGVFNIDKPGLDRDIQFV